MFTGNKWNRWIGALTKRGEKLLNKSTLVIARIYYISEGNELLCFKTAPITKAEYSEHLHNLKHSLAVRVECFPESTFLPPPWKDARAVIFPSQGAQ